MASGVVPARARQYFPDLNGKPLASGSVEVLFSGTPTRMDTFQDQALTTLNENPIPLDARGECLIYLTGLNVAKFIVRDKNDVTIYTEDPVLVGGDIPVTAQFVVDTFTTDGVQTAFTLSVSPSSEQNTSAHLGATYIPKSGYTVSGPIITFATPPAAGTMEVTTIEVVEFAASADLISEQTAEAVASAEAAATSETNAATSETNAAASEAAAAASALDAQASAGLYDTLAAGEAATATNKYFSVRQATGKGAYVYKRTATGSQWVDVVAIGARAAQVAYERALKGTLAPPVAGLTTHLWGQSAWEWDQRLVPNEASAVLPTLNWLPDPFDPLNENGSSLPTRTYNTGATTDPLGGSNAEQLDFNAQNQQHVFYVSTEPAVPATDIRIRLFTKLLSGGSAFKLGTTSGTSITPGASWDVSSLEATIAGYTGSSSIGVSTAVGNTAASLAVAGAAIFDPLAGESATLPSLATMLAAQQAGHMKASLARPGGLPLTAQGAISLDGANGLTPMVYLDASAAVLSSYSFGCVMNCAALPVTTSGSAMSMDNHAGITAGATNAHGQIGVYGATDSVAGRPGRIFMNPAGSVAINQGNQYFPGEGYQSVIVTVNAGDVMLYINGVPQWLGVVGGWVNPAIARLIFGAYAATTARRKTLTPFVGEINGAFFAKNKVMTQAEVTAQDKHMRARLRLYGQSIGPRKVCNIGGGDSLCEFSPSWWWHLGESTWLSPRLHGHKEAQGGTRLRTRSSPQVGDWVNATRFSRLVQRIQAADAAGYDAIDFYILPGANDSIEAWVNDGYSYLPWKTEFLAYLASIKAVSSKVRIVVLTMLPRVGSGDELRIEQQRQAWNDDLRANYASMGIDRLIDTGLGTERIDLSSVVTAETIAGGTVMGNWREAKAAQTSTRNPATGLTLSALSGASFTATAVAGTFTSSDVYRVIVAGTGEAKITAVNGDGSVATLSTTNYVPPAMPNEPAAITARDTITRAAFDSLTYASAGWTVRQDAVTTTRYYQTDGLHPGYPGGRVLAEIVWPHAKALQDPLVGLAL